MSPNYRIYDDRWRIDRTVKDEPADLSATFDLSKDLMDEIARMVNSFADGPRNIEKLITDEMAEVVYGSNHIERLGVGLDETLRLCLLIFSDEEGWGDVDRYVYFRVIRDPSLCYF